MLTTAIFAIALLTPVHSTPTRTCCDMASLANDPAFLAAHVSPAPVNFVLKEGSTVNFPDANGKSASGYYVAPKPGNRSAVVLVHEFWGLNDYIRREAERLHDETGYAVIAVDLYEGQVTTDPKMAGQLMQAVDDGRAKAIVKGAVSALKSGTFGFQAKRIGSVGYCFGGHWSEEVAIQGSSDVNACVMYYGLPDNSPEALQALKAPVLLIYGKKDTWINDNVAKQFADTMKAARKPYEVVGYDDYHAFANPSNPHYDQSSADDAHKRELAWLKKKLG
jgi:carboxymethylenebutenolidase